MSMQYQMESSHIADYGLWTLPGIDFPLRGPPVAIDGKAPGPTLSPAKRPSMAPEATRNNNAYPI